MFLINYSKYLKISNFIKNLLKILYIIKFLLYIFYKCFKHKRYIKIQNTISFKNIVKIYKPIIFKNFMEIKRNNLILKIVLIIQ